LHIEKVGGHVRTVVVLRHGLTAATQHQHSNNPKNAASTSSSTVNIRLQRQHSPERYAARTILARTVLE
jgi:hypothetical protein